MYQRACAGWERKRRERAIRADTESRHTFLLILVPNLVQLMG